MGFYCLFCAVFKGKDTIENLSREWFRSTDLWVMGPARFHCATLLTRFSRVKNTDFEGKNTVKEAKVFWVKNIVKNGVKYSKI